LSIVREDESTWAGGYIGARGWASRPCLGEVLESWFAVAPALGQFSFACRRRGLPCLVLLKIESAWAFAFYNAGSDLFLARWLQ
jgi:hypothetical protein